MPPHDDENTGASQEMPVIDQVKDLRAKYAELEKYLVYVKGRPEARPAIAEMTLAQRELQSSRHWLGEVLGALGEPSPYKA